MQFTTETAHFLNSRGQASSVRTKSRSPHSLAAVPRTRIVNMVHMWHTREATHLLDRRDSRRQQVPIAGHQRSHSLAGVPRTSHVSRV